MVPGSSLSWWRWSALVSSLSLASIANAQDAPPPAPRCSSRSADGCVCVSRERAISLVAERRADKAFPEARCPDTGPDPTWAALSAAVSAALTFLLTWLW
jgi:hypothetical protein